MPDILHFTCGHCGKQLSAKPQHVGRSTRCPGCERPVTVPHPDPVPNQSGSLSEDEAFQSLEEVDIPIPTPPQHKAADQRAVLFQELANNVENNEIAAALSIIDQLKRNASGEDFADLWKLERELKKSQQTEWRTTAHRSHPTTTISDTRESSPPKKVMVRQTIPALNLDELVESTISEVTTPQQRTASPRTTREPTSALPQVTHSGWTSWIVTAVAVGSVIVVTGLFAAFQLGKATVMRSDKPPETALLPLAETPRTQGVVLTPDISTQSDTRTKADVAPGPANTKDTQSEVMKRLEISTKTVETVVTSYLAAKTWEERLPLMVNIDAVPSKDSLLAPPGIYRPGTFKSSSSSTDGEREMGSAEVDVSVSHPDQPTLSFNLVRTSKGFKIDAAVMKQVAAQAQMNAMLAEIRDSKPTVEVTILKMEKSVSSIRLDFRITNNSKLHLGYVGFNLSFFDSEGGFVGTCLQNAVNLRAGASSTDQGILSGGHSLEEIAKIKVSDLQLRTQTSTGAAINAGQFYSSDLRLDSNRPVDETQLERTFRGQWLNDSGESKTRIHFSPDARAMFIGASKEAKFSTEVTMRNYSSGEFGLRMFHPDGTGIGGVYKPIRKGVFRMTRGQLRVAGNPNWSPPDDDPTKGPVQTYIDAREVP